MNKNQSFTLTLIPHHGKSHVVDIFGIEDFKKYLLKATETAELPENPTWGDLFYETTRDFKGYRLDCVEDTYHNVIAVIADKKVY